MNEKIRELMMQAGEYAKSVWVHPTEENYVSWHDLFNDKFVELIIKECAQVCRDQPDIYALKADRDNCAIAIENHFGVE